MASAQTIAEMKVVFTADGVRLKEVTQEVGKELTDTEKAFAAQEKMIMRLAGAHEPLIRKLEALAKGYNALNAVEALNGVTDQTVATRQALDAKNEKLLQQKTLHQQAAEEARQASAAEMAAHRQVLESIDPLLGKLNALEREYDILDRGRAAGHISESEHDSSVALLDLKFEKLLQQKTLHQQVVEEAQKAAVAEAEANQRFLESIDPVLRAFNELDSRVAKLRHQFETGVIDEAKFNHFSAILEKNREDLNAAAEGAKKLQAGCHGAAVDVAKLALLQKELGLSAHQAGMALGMLPFQITDIVTSLASGQVPWMVLIQQGGQIKDSFGGVANTFKALPLLISPAMLGIGALAAAGGALGWSYYQGDQILSGFNKTLTLSGNASGLTADRMLALAESATHSGVRFSAASEAITALAKAGVQAGDDFEALTVVVSRFAKTSGIGVDEVAKAFGDLTSDPVGGLMAMAAQFHNVTAAQIDHVAVLQRSGDAASALQAANEAATQGFDRQTQALKQNMGTLESAAGTLGDAFKSMWDKVLDIGRPDTADNVARKAQAEYDHAKQIYDLRSKDPAVGAEARARYFDDMNRARLNLDMAQQQAGAAKTSAEWQKHQSEQAEARVQAEKEYLQVITAGQTNAEKRAADAEKWAKELKNGVLSQAQYDAMIAADAQRYKDPKSPAYHDDEGTKRLATLKEQAEVLREQSETLKGTLSLDDRLTDSDKKLAAFRAEIAGLTGKKLTAEQQSLLLHQGEIDTQLRLNAAQEKENLIIQAANKLMAEQRGIRLSTDKLKAQTDADVAGVTLSQKEREHQEKIQSIRDSFAAKQMQLEDDKVQYTKKQLLEQTEFNRQQMQEQIDTVIKGEQAKTAAQQDFLDGAMVGMQDWANNQMDLADRVRQATTGLFDNMSQSVINFALTGKLNFRDFTSEVLKDIAKIAMQVAISKAVSAILSSFGGGGGSTPSGAYDAAAGSLSFAPNALGGTYRSASLSAFSGQVVARPTLFAFAHGAGLMGEAGPEGIFPLRRGADGRLGVVAQMAGGGMPVFAPQYHINIQNDGQNGQIGPQAMQAVYDIGKKAAADYTREQQRDGGSMRRF